MKAYTDGACRCGNPGETSCAFAVFNSDMLMHSESLYLGPTLHTNNYAEYQGLLLLLHWAHDNNISELEIYSDSALVVNQINGDWRVNDQSLSGFRFEAYALLSRGRHILRHIKGHNGDPGNEYVDKLCNEVLDKEFEKIEKNSRYK